MRTILFSAIALALPAIGAETKLEPTHRQALVLKPERSNTSVEMAAFSLDANGDIVTAIRDAGGSAGWIQVYSPERKLLREHALEFAPTAFGLTPAGDYLVAGHGTLCKMTADGKIAEKASVLKALGLDPKAVREEAIAEWRKEQEEFGGRAESQKKSYTTQIERIEKIAEAERTDRDKNRLSALKQMLERLEKQAKAEPPEREIKQMTERRMYVPSISQSSAGPVITVSKGRGYEVVQLDEKFANPKPLIGGLRGCCGQMDVTCAGDKLFAAENTKFRVGIYGLDGKLQSAFGERYKEGNNGFGSCCNPMNVVPQSNGDVLTAESSIGTIKRFDSTGKLVGIIGRARIGGGCKHVSLGHDQKRDRYYVQFEDSNHICILLPNAEAAPLVAEQDKVEKEAEAAMLKLVGKWTLNGAKPGGTKKLSSLLFGDEEVFSEGKNFKQIEIRADHGAKLDSRDDEDGFRRWVVTGMEKDAIVVEMEESDGYVDFVSKIVAKDESTIEIDGRTFKKAAK